MMSDALEHHRAIAVLERDALQVSRRVGRLAGLALVLQLGRQRRDLRGQRAQPPLAHPAFRPFQRFAEPLVRERLQHVVGRADLEGLGGVAAEGGDEDDDGRLLGQAGRYLEAGGTWHLDVQERDVGPLAGDAFARAGGVAAFEHRLDLGIVLQQVGDDAARQRLVVGHQDAEARGHARHVAAAGPSSGVEAGNAISTIVPAALPARTSKRGRGSIQLREPRARVAQPGAGMPLEVEIARQARRRRR